MEQRNRHCGTKGIREKESFRGEAKRDKGDKGCNLMVNSTYAYKGQSKCVSGVGDSEYCLSTYVKQAILLKDFAGYII